MNKLIFNSLAQMDKLKLILPIKVDFLSGQVKFGVTCPDGQVYVNSHIVHYIMFPSEQKQYVCETRNIDH